MGPKRQVGRPPETGRKVRYPEIADRIQTLMSKRGLVRRDMAKALGCTDGLFGYYFNGFRFPDGKYADKIADMLGVSVGYLLYGKKEEAPTIIEGPATSVLTPEDKYILRKILEKLAV